MEKSTIGCVPRLSLFTTLFLVVISMWILSVIATSWVTFSIGGFGVTFHLGSSSLAIGFGQSSQMQIADAGGFWNVRGVIKSIDTFAGFHYANVEKMHHLYIPIWAILLASILLFGIFIAYRERALIRSDY